MLASKSVLRFHELIQMRNNVIIFQLVRPLPRRSRLPAVLSAVAMGLLVFGCKEKPRPAPPPKVQVVTVAPQDVPIYQQWIGTLDGYPNAQIRAQVSGYLIKQDYVEGSEVKKGDLLFELIRGRFRRRWTRRWANWRRTRRSWARRSWTSNVTRRWPSEQAVSQEELDDAIQANLMAKAAVVQADQAAVESATAEP